MAGRGNYGFLFLGGRKKFVLISVRRNEKTIQDTRKKAGRDAKEKAVLGIAW